jgi:hypothetical protein
MDTKTIKLLLNKIVPKKASLNIILYACLKDGLLIADNLEERIEIDTGTNLTGLLDVKLFSKTLDLESSVASLSSLTEDDFPKAKTEETAYTVTPISPKLFSSDLAKYQNYVSTDITRNSLCGVFFNPDRNERIATNGHVLLLESFPEGCELSVPFILAARALPIFSVLPEITSAEYCSYEPRRENGHINSEQSSYLLTLRGEGYTFYTTLVKDQYPDYLKTIPEPSSCCPPTTVTRDYVILLIRALDKLLPFANKKNTLVVLDDEEIFVHNSDIRKHFRINLGSRLTPRLGMKYDTKVYDMTGERTLVAVSFPFGALGINATYFKNMLEEILKGEAEKFQFLFFRSNIGAIQVRTDNKIVIQMPLRILADDGGESITSYPAEYLTLEEVKPKATKPKATKPRTKKLDKQVESLVLEMVEKYGKKAVTDMLNNLDLI